MICLLINKYKISQIKIKFTNNNNKIIKIYINKQGALQKHLFTNFSVIITQKKGFFFVVVVCCFYYLEFYILHFY